MGRFVTIVVACAACVAGLTADILADAPKSADQAEALRRLSTEYEVTQQSALENASNAKTDAERDAARLAMPDKRGYLRRILDLAKGTKDDAVAVDAVVWVVRNGFIRNGLQTPEAEEAIRLIAERYVRNDRIGPACRALGASKPDGEFLLERILDENPNPAVKGRACLALAFAGSMRLRHEGMNEANLPPRQVDMLEVREIELQKRKLQGAEQAERIELRLKRVLDEFPDVLLEPDVSEYWGLLSENLGPAAGEILQRIMEKHPNLERRWDAECALALQRMKLASLVASVKAVAAAAPGAKQCSGPGLAAARVAGGEARLFAIDSAALVSEIEERLQKVTEHAGAIETPGICYFHLIMDTPTLHYYNAGTELLLRRVAADGTARSRLGAQRALAMTLAGISDLSRTIETDRGYWIDRLGKDRVEQIRRMDADRLLAEASALAEGLSEEYRKTGKTPDTKIEELRNGKRGVGADARSRKS